MGRTETKTGEFPVDQDAPSNEMPIAGLLIGAGNTVLPTICHFERHPKVRFQ